MSYQALVLAAGCGSRFGGTKQLADWNGGPLISAVVRSALASAVSEVLVVLGHEAEAVSAALRPIDRRRTRVVVAENWERGLSASLRAGIAALPASSAGVVVFLGDMPAVPPWLADDVIAALRDGAPAVQFWRDDQPGHPIGLSKVLYDDLMRLEGDAGAGKLIRAMPGVTHLKTDELGAVFDVDRRGDIDAFKLR